MVSRESAGVPARGCTDIDGLLVARTAPDGATRPARIVSSPGARGTASVSLEPFGPVSRTTRCDNGLAGRGAADRPRATLGPPLAAARTHHDRDGSRWPARRRAGRRA